MSTSMQIEREDLNPCTIKLNVVCSQAQVATGFQKAYKQIAKQIRVPGFRPGQAPKQVVAKLVSPDDVKNAAAEEIVRSSLNEAIKQEKIRPHDSPAVELKEIDEASGKCEYTAKVPLEPQVTLGTYKGIEIKRPKVEVTAAEVDAQIAELQKRSAKREAVTDRGIHEGDMAVVNIKVDGDEGDGRNFMMVVGQSFKDLDAVLDGMQVEEIKVTTLSFPKSFQDENLAGKKKKVQVSIRSASTLASPDLTDEFAQNAGKDLKAKDLKELREKISERLKTLKEAMGQEYVNEAIQEELLKSSTVYVPDNMWEAVANQRLREEAMKAQQDGKTFEQLAEEAGMSSEDFIARWQHEAKVQVQRAVIANTIFKVEKMRLNQQDYNETLVAMAQEYNVHPAALLDYLKKNKGLYEVEVRGVYRKVMDFLNENAKIVEV